jgi:hypothetical protein
MSFNGGIIAPIMTAVASVLTALAMPFVIVFQYITGKRAEERDAALAANVTNIKEHTDGMVGQIEAMAKERGHAEGVEHATVAAEAKAATLAEGQAQGRAQAHMDDRP